MMFFGRIVGWVMMIAGVGLLARYFGDLLATGGSMRVAISDMWQGTDRLLANYAAGSAMDNVSAVMLSGPVAALLIIFGILLVWGCRTGPLRD
jgi:hypothetical protein